MELVFQARTLSEDGAIEVGVGCAADGCDALLPVTLSAEWSEVRLSLSCFADLGVDMSTFNKSLILSASAGQSVAISEVRLDEDQDAAANCG